MNKAAFLIIASACFLHCGISIAVPLVKLIVSPCDYNEKEVYTSGYLGFISPGTESKNARLFLTLDDFKFNNLEQSVMVNIPDEIVFKRELYNKNYVTVAGIYDCSLMSHGHAYSGGIKTVTRLQLAYRNPNFNPNEFTNGEIKDVQNNQYFEFGQSILDKFTQKKSNQNLYKLLFESLDEKSIKVERLDWVFDNYLADLNSKNFKICKIYLYQEQEYLETDGIIDGFVCYSKSNCDSFDFKDAKNLPDWSSSENEICFQFENNSSKTKLDLIQFY